MATILDVAREAGVSKSTVSRVINNEGTVKPATRKAVEDAIEKLGYFPSYFAQGMRTGFTKTIAMVVPEYTNPFYQEMFRGVEDVALKYGYMVFVCNTERHTVSDVEYTRELLKRNIDGIIYNTYHRNDEVSEYLKKVSKQIAIVFMDKIFDDCSEVSYVYVDGFESVRRAVRYLYNQGHRRIGYILNTEDISVIQERYLGYLKGLEDCGLEADEKWIYRVRRENEPDYIKLGKDAARYYVSLAERPDVIMAAIDMIGIGCIKGLDILNIKVPEEIGVMGFDNIQLSDLIKPALTTISQPTRKLGQTAAEIVIAKINGEKIKDQVAFQGDLIVRETT